MTKSAAGTGPGDRDASQAREAAIQEIISLLEEALLRCDSDAFQIAAIHIDRAIYECRKRANPPDDKAGH